MNEKNVLQLQTDAELTLSFQKGDDRCMEELITRHKDRIFTSIYMLVKDQYLAEDIFQDTFLKIICNIRKGHYAEQGKFLPWAIRMAHNLCMDHFRKIKSNAPATLCNGQDLTPFLSHRNENPVLHLEAHQTELSVKQLIHTLPVEQREVMVLRLYGEYSFKEIAEMTNVSINTALGRMRYGLISLRKKIEKYQLELR